MFNSDDQWIETRTPTCPEIDFGSDSSSSSSSSRFNYYILEDKLLLTFSFDFDDSEAPQVIEVDYTTIDKIKKVKTYGKISKVKKNITAEVRDTTIA